jgi:hypothetical protein
MEYLWTLVGSYKNYPVNFQEADKEIQEDDDLLRPLLSGDDDTVSFSDGDQDDDLAGHAGEHDQEGDGPFIWDDLD